MNELWLTTQGLASGAAGTAIVITFFIFLLYSIIVTGSYLTLNIIALFAVRRATRDGRDLYMPKLHERSLPGVSLLLTAYNEEQLIAASVKSLLQLNYPDFELLVIHDGGKDSTMDVMINTFEMHPYPAAFRYDVPCARIKCVYKSYKYPNLILLDKENGGGKADAINAGINIASKELFCSMDADSILERDALQRVVRLFLNKPGTIAAGGTVRIINGCKVKDGNLVSVGLPSSYLARFQVLEYLRAFLFGRLGWSTIKALLIISGAFGVFKRETVVKVGGFTAKCLGEDMDLVVKLHKHHIDNRIPYHINFVPDPVCWTDAPEDLGTLKKQRVRWQRGLLEVLIKHRSLLFSKRSGTVGWVAYPFMIVVEAISPIMEFLGLIFTLVLYFMGYLNGAAALVFLFASVGLGLLLSTSAILLEERSFHVYKGYRPSIKLFILAVVENFGYRQLNSWWRLQGTFQHFKGSESKWGEMKRNTGWISDDSK